MAYQISIISGSKEQPLTLDAVMAAAAPPNDLGLVPGKTAGRILVRRAGGLETELIWSDRVRLLYTTQPETDVVAAMIGLAAKLGGRVRGENFETYRTPSESYDHPDDKDFIARGRGGGRRFRHQPGRGAHPFRICPP